MFFKYEWKFNVLFGCGASLSTGMKVRDLGCKKVLVVCDEGVIQAGIAGKIIANLNNAGVETVIYDKVLPDPPDYSIDEAGALAVAEKVDGIVGIGGGSVLDSAKATNLLINNPAPINNYFGSVPFKPGFPVICIPTTSGTGCEQSGGAVITDTKKNAKGAVSTGAPTLAIVDPELTLGLPKSLTLGGAMDAFAHSAEVVTSVYPTYFTEILMLDGVRTIMKYLPVALADGKNIEAREKIMFAASVAGSTFSIAYPHLGHAIGHTLGAKFHIPHGFAVVACLPQVIEYVALSVPDQVRRLGEAMGLVIEENVSREELGKQVGAAIHELKVRHGVPTLSEMGISLEDALSIIPMIFDDVMYMFSPRMASAEDLRKILTAAYSYESKGGNA